MKRFYHVILEQVTWLEKTMYYGLHPIILSKILVSISIPCFMNFFLHQECKINKCCAVTPKAQHLINSHRRQFVGISHSKTKGQNDSQLLGKAPKHFHILFFWYSSINLKVMYSHVIAKKNSW